MAMFRAYAKVLEPDDPTMRIYEAGLRACPGEPGMPLAEVLRRSGGVYQTTTPLIPHMRDDIRELAELTSDAELLKIAELTEVPVSLEYLRGLDPQTRIIISPNSAMRATKRLRSALPPGHAMPWRRLCLTAR
jgi:hypothetical protein